MDFYHRHQELELLEKLDQQAHRGGVITALTGRRRVGKTKLALHHAAGKRFLYLFVARKEEGLLCQEFMEEIQKRFQIPILKSIRYFKDIFALLLEIAKKEKFTLIFDEFHEFFQINPSIYADLQKLWDLNKLSTKLHIMFIGSVCSLMHKIFKDEKQPLFGRADHILHLKPLSLETTRTLLKEKGLFNAENFYNLYVLTGNSPQYLNEFLNTPFNCLEDMLKNVLHKNSVFLNDGKNLLIEEFGRDYLTYFAILELIAHGKTSRGEIESLLEKDIGGYLQRLETDYAIVRRHRPIHAQLPTRNQKYTIDDNYLNFWFRFIYRYQTAIETENFSFIKEMILRDYPGYSSPILERFFQALLAETGQFNQIGAYWEKNDHFDVKVAAINDHEKHILIAETQLSPYHEQHPLAMRAQSLLKHYPDYTPRFLAFTVQDSLMFNDLFNSTGVA